jgi:hypothetical protein
MASKSEKELLGLPADADDKTVEQRINELLEQAKKAENSPTENAELSAQLDELQSKIEECERNAIAQKTLIELLLKKTNTQDINEAIIKLQAWQPEADKIENTQQFKTIEELKNVAKYIAENYAWKVFYISKTSGNCNQNEEETKKEGAYLVVNASFSADVEFSEP